MAIVLKSPDEIKQIERANRLLHFILDRLIFFVSAGRTPRAVAERFEAMTRQSGAQAAFKNYQRTPESAPFPAACCISVNAVLTHGVPGDRLLKSGDLVKVDAGLCFDGWYADAARSIVIAPAPIETRNIAMAAELIFHTAIAACRPGQNWGVVRAAAAQRAVELSVQLVPDVAGHGIGRRLHEAPSLPLALNHPSDVDGLILREGMVLAIEPVVSAGSSLLVRSPDGFGLETSDGSSGSHYEECIAIESSGPRRLRGL